MRIVKNKVMILINDDYWYNIFVFLHIYSKIIKDNRWKMLVISKMAGRLTTMIKFPRFVFLIFSISYSYSSFCLSF